MLQLREYNHNTSRTVKAARHLCHREPTQHEQHSCGISSSSSVPLRWVDCSIGNS